MIETRSAILALILLSFLTLQFKGNVYREREDMMRSEIQLIASGVGVEHLDAVGVMEFDDIPNLHGEHRTVEVVRGEYTFSFELDSSVTYVKRDGETFVVSTGVTNYLRVTVSVDGILEGSIHLSRIYSRASN